MTPTEEALKEKIAQRDKAKKELKSLQDEVKLLKEKLSKEEFVEDKLDTTPEMETFLNDLIFENKIPRKVVLELARKYFEDLYKTDTFSRDIGRDVFILNQRARGVNYREINSQIKARGSSGMLKRIKSDLQSPTVLKAISVEV